VSNALRALLDLHGIEPEYFDGLGEFRQAPFESLAAGLAALGTPISSPDHAEDALRSLRASRSREMLDPVVVHEPRGSAIVAWLPRGRPTRFEISLADGSTLEGPARGLDVVDTEGDRDRVRLWLDVEIPRGRHRLTLESGGEEGAALLLAPPERAFRHEVDRSFGLFVPLYAAHDRRSALPDFEHLRALVALASERGGEAVGTLPLFATFLDQPFEPSPYTPVSRRFFNELFLEVEGGTNESSLFDYRAAYAYKAAVLGPKADAYFRDGAPEAFAAFLARHPDVLDYARFRAGRAGAHPLDASDLADPTIRFHLYAQEACFSALERAAGPERRLYLDFPVGVHAHGYDARRHAHVFLNGLEAGAPPDALFHGGQTWGFSPMHPRGVLSDELAYLDGAYARTMRFARLLRIDHVMGLARIFCVPPGFGATEGFYVREPVDALDAQLRILSHEHRTEIVGEDLGTVPDRVRQRMRDGGYDRMYVLPFEIPQEPGQEPRPVAPEQLACLGTHDTAPFASWLAQSDIDRLVALGLATDEWRDHARQSREREIENLTRFLGTREPKEILERVLGWLGRSESRLVLVQIEDLLFETEPQNVPGTTSQHPNWQRRLRVTLDALARDPEIAALLAAIGRR
jgi:4-alpha-glucanotransferase